jgi:transposase InsO family protein
MADRLDAPLVVAALQMAIARREPTAAVIVHSDRGAEFASGVYRKTLASHGLIPSMSRTGNCYDNAHIESFWSSLKHELIYRQRFGSRAEARSAIFDYIESFYNRRRLHSSLGYQSPLDFEAQLN